METTFFNSKMGRLLGSLSLAMLILALGSYALLNINKLDSSADMVATISVNGTGEVLAVPDIGQFSFSVNADGETADAAQEASGTKINAILAYLKEQGVEDKDIKTANYTLYPKYRYEERVCAFNSYCPPGERIEDGFEVDQTVTVKIRETDKATTIIAGVGEQGATNISGLDFTIDDMEALRTEAREKAIADAKEKAETLAQQLGVRLVRIVSYYENNGNYPEPYYDTKVMTMEATESAGFGGAELPVGENSTTASVSITYEIK